jgi:hypothetical protein
MQMRAVLRLAVVATVTALSSAAAQSIRTVTIDSRASCARCTIQLTPAVRIGDRDGPGSLDNERSWVVRDSRGRFFVLYAYATAIKLFDSTGNYVGSLGKKGGGPGEFDGVSGVHIGVGDSLHVLDWGTSRHSVFAPDLKYIRSNPIALQPQLRWIMLPDTRIVENLTIRTPEQLGKPLHLLGADGNVVRSFGSETEAHRPDFPGLGDRALAPHKGSLIWSAHQRAYVIDIVDVNTGAIVSRIVRRAEWLPETEPQRTRIGSSADDPPISRLAAVHQDAEGLLWVTISVPDPRWKTAVKPGEARHVTITDPVKYTDNIIDVIDPVRGTLLVTQRFDDIPPWFIGEGYASQYRTTPDGSPYFEILRMHIRRQ